MTAAPEGGILKKCRGEDKNGVETVFWHALRMPQTSFTVGLTFELNILPVDTGNPCKEA